MWKYSWSKASEFFAFSPFRDISNSTSSEFEISRVDCIRLFFFIKMRNISKDWPISSKSVLLNVFIYIKWAVENVTSLIFQSSQLLSKILWKSHPKFLSSSTYDLHMLENKFAILLIMLEFFMKVHFLYLILLNWNNMACSIFHKCKICTNSLKTIWFKVKVHKEVICKNIFLNVALCYNHYSCFSRFKVAPRVEKIEVFKKGWNFVSGTCLVSSIMKKHCFIMEERDDVFSLFST